MPSGTGSSRPSTVTPDGGSSRLPLPDPGLRTSAIFTRRTLDLPRVFGRIDHIGVAVEDLDAAIELYERTFGMQLVHRETVEEQGVEAVLFDVGENHVELLRPLGPDTPVGKFLAKKGPGLHPVPDQVD